MRSVKKNYKFQNAEIGVMSEIMLPKKIQYQSSVFESLLKGIKQFPFTEYYKKNRKKIDKLLENYPSLRNISDERISLLDTTYRTIFKGYSMYEVDGVFRFTSRSSEMKFVEERTQIVRIYYIPDYKYITELVNRDSDNHLTIQTIMNFADLFFSNSKVTSFDSANIENRLQPLFDFKFLRTALGFDEDQWKHQRNTLFDYFINWVDAVAFFTFGYVINELTIHICKMKRHKNIEELEEEIWVASQWGVLINKTILQ